MLEIENIKEENGQPQSNNELRTKKSKLNRRPDRIAAKTKLKLPPGKNNNKLPFNEYCAIDEGDTGKICGGWCVAESNDSTCKIF